MDDSAPEGRAAYFRGVAGTLRGIATDLRYDPRRRAQLLALADGFERFAHQLEQGMNVDA